MVKKATNKHIITPQQIYAYHFFDGAQTKHAYFYILGGSRARRFIVSYLGNTFAHNNLTGGDFNMAVIYREKEKTITLKTRNSSYQMKIGRADYLLHLYYGPQTADCGP